MNTRLNARPRGLHTPGRPVTVADPYSPAAQREEAARLAALAAAATPAGIPWEPVEPREVAKIRQAIEFQVEAANRGVVLRPLVKP